MQLDLGKHAARCSRLLSGKYFALPARAGHKALEVAGFPKKMTVMLLYRCGNLACLVAEESSDGMMRACVLSFFENLSSTVSFRIRCSEQWSFTSGLCPLLSQQIAMNVFITATCP